MTMVLLLTASTAFLINVQGPHQKVIRDYIIFCPLSTIPIYKSIKLQLTN